MISRVVTVCVVGMWAGIAQANGPVGVATYTYDAKYVAAGTWTNGSGWPIAHTTDEALVQNDALLPHAVTRTSGFDDRIGQNYPANVIRKISVTSNADGSDSFTKVQHGVYNTWFDGATGISYDHHAQMIVGGTGRYAGVTGAFYSVQPDQAQFSSLGVDPSGNPVWDWSSATWTSNAPGYLSIPVSTGAPSATLPHTLTMTYRIRGTEYGSFQDQVNPSGSGFTRTYAASFDGSSGPVTWAETPFPVNSITTVVDNGGGGTYPASVLGVTTTLSGAEGSLIGHHTGFHNVPGATGLAGMPPADPATAYGTTGYEAFVTVLTEGTGAYAGARGVIFGWRQGIQQPEGLDPLVVTYWDGYVSVPVPEPGTYAMMAMGLGLVGAMALRRTRDRGRIQRPT